MSAVGSLVSSVGFRVLNVDCQVSSVQWQVPDVVGHRVANVLYVHVGVPSAAMSYAAMSAGDSRTYTVNAHVLPLSRSFVCLK